jgi:hypothetical protein
MRRGINHVRDAGVPRKKTFVRGAISILSEKRGKYSLFALDSSFKTVRDSAYLAGALPSVVENFRPIKEEIGVYRTYITLYATSRLYGLKFLSDVPSAR